MEKGKGRDVRKIITALQNIKRLEGREQRGVSYLKTEASTSNREGKTSSGGQGKTVLRRAIVET